MKKLKNISQKIEKIKNKKRDTKISAECRK